MKWDREELARFIGTTGIAMLVAGYLRYTIQHELLTFSKVVLAIGALCLLASIVIGFGGILRFFSKRSSQQGTNTTVLGAAVIAILIIVNFVGFRHHKRFDLTTEKLYTLSDQTKQIVGGLQKDVAIVHFDKSSNAALDDQMAEYTSLSHHLKFQNIDPQQKPEIAEQYGATRPGDVILNIDGRTVQRFEDVQQAVRLNPGVPMSIVVKRDGEEITLHVTPTRTEMTDRFGNRYEMGLLGIGRSGMEYIKRDPGTALLQAVGETWNLSASTLEAMWQMVKGTRNTDELGGPLRIAQMSGEVARGGVAPTLTLMALLSVSLGLINLFPVPVLDGGHLLFYAAEAVRGKPLGQRAQEYGFRIGLALVLTLMIFATWNDLVHLGIWSRLKGFVT